VRWVVPSAPSAMVLGVASGLLVGARRLFAQVVQVKVRVQLEPGSFYFLKQRVSWGNEIAGGFSREREKRKREKQKNRNTVLVVRL
jgi:hypothetical protein